ncbi:DNA polymerase III subunit tau [Roseovarius litorisediminis]|uniref:DNA polymerase III subunit tau n=1 Tax=Roseovarius litorisediminis TaxID=1312363 RepID=A0A1Y5T3Y6_9RHOB|nr:DNA polymerase III subunit delta' [Roseovarius litorisediminis]SLN55221.1 DNA polymerase III subunit tau [Roseovarius litorisediminis]
MSADDAPRPDCVDGAPHPRETPQLMGQGTAEAAFLEVYNAGRMHHGWLIAGPLGVGKATLAWRIARFLLATPETNEGGLFGDAPLPASLDIGPDHPVSRRLLAGSDPGLFHITRSVNEKTSRLRDKIVAEDVRNLNHFLHFSATDGGRRVVIIDSADEMNTQAANALLKMLEEPPARTFLLLVSHQPSRLLPTIRSRCRELRLPPLGARDMAQALTQAGIDPGQDTAALAELSGGSVGEAVRLINLGGLRMYAELVGLYDTLPRLDRPRALKLAEAAATRGAEEKLDLLLGLNDLLLARLARAGAIGSAPVTEAAPGEAQMLTRLAPTPEKGRAWADCAQEIGARARHGRSVNLDPAVLVLDTVFKIQQTAAG